MVRVLVTGGAGFIGSNLTPQLLKLGHSVLVFNNLSTGQLENIPDSSSISLAQGDIRDYDQVLAAVQGIDVVFHIVDQLGRAVDGQDLCPAGAQVAGQLHSESSESDDGNLSHVRLLPPC